ncbi:MAG: hypothetical protein JWP27_2379, partial [Flaviaesturariibacter sp.]|nr:hypothetical protein [Flaviaesturariibacter sp.]
MKTKHLIKFLSNSAHLDADLEFVDILKVAVSDGALKLNASDLVFDHVVKVKHKKLAKRANTDHSRKLVVNHLKGSIRAAFIKGIYEAASVYFQDILKAVVKKGINTDRLLGEHNKNFSCKEIIELGSYAKIQDAIALAIFRQLENERSTKALLEKMIKKLGLTIAEELITDALPYFEIRHKLVHAEGKADRQFCVNFPNIEAEEDKPIRLSFKIVTEANDTIIALIKEFDLQIVANNLVST